MKPKTRIKKVFLKTIENVSNGKQPNVSQEMRLAGYAETSVRCQKITHTKTWQLLEQKYVNPAEEQAVQTLYDLSSPDNEDKDNRLKASIEVLKLKSRYPKDNLSIDFNFQRKDLLVNDNEE